jgi:hypothetical protein
LAQFGPPGTIVTSPQSFVSFGGIAGTLTLSDVGLYPANIVQQCCAGLSGLWDGNFFPGDILFSTGGTASLTLSFATPLRTVGTQIDMNT